MKRLLSLAAIACAFVAAVPASASAACPPTNDQMGCSLPKVFKGVSVTPKGEIVPDVSSYQRTVNWADVKAWQLQHGWKIPGGIFKLGEYVPDPYASQNATELHSLGMIAVGYWFVRPTDAYTEAGEILSEASSLRIHVIVLDEEVAGIEGYARVITPILQKAGYKVVDYHAQGNVLDSSADGMLCWTADLGPSTRPDCTTGPTVGWQFTWYGYVPGVVGQVDESISYGLLKLAVPPKPKPAKTVCFGKGATPKVSKCQRALKLYGWLIARRDFWRTEFGRCILYADGEKCEHPQHWAIVRGEQATKLKAKYSS